MKRKLYVDETEILYFVQEQLDQVAEASFPCAEQVCPHCRCHIRFPLIARRRDIEDFQKLMNTAMEVMQEWGITGKLLATIRARCAIAIASKSDSKQ